MKVVTTLEAARDIRGFAAKRALSAGELHGSAPAIRICHSERLGRTDTLTGPIKIWMSAHALAILQSLILISAANGRPSCSRGYSELALLIRSTGGSCGAITILYSVVPRLGEASPQLFFLRPAPQSS